MGPAAALCLLLAVSIFVVPKMGMDLIPGMAQGEFFIDIRLPVGSSLEQTQQTAGQIEEIVRNQDGVETVIAIVGSDMTSSASLGAEQEHMATLQVILRDDTKDSTGEAEIISILRGSLTDITGLRKLEFRKPIPFDDSDPSSRGSSRKRSGRSDECGSAVYRSTEEGSIV